MRSSLFKILFIAFLANLLAASHAFAADVVTVADGPVSRVGNTGISGLWLLANMSYAGMRAQGNRNKGWRILAFIFGFPGTLVSFLAVDENSERAYGIDLPRRDGYPHGEAGDSRGGSTTVY